jgi:hypothetical protein
MIGLANACSSYHFGMVFTTNFRQDSVLWMGHHQFCHVGPGYRPIVMQKTTGGNQQSAFAKLFFEVPVSVRSSAMFFVIADLCKAEFPFMTKV